MTGVHILKGVYSEDTSPNGSGHPACGSLQAGNFSGHLFQNEAPAQFSDYQTEDKVELRYLVWGLLKMPFSRLQIALD